MPLICKNCQGPNVFTCGAGTQLAEDLIKKIAKKLDDRRPIIRIDSDQNDLLELKKDQDKIIVCTNLAWSKLEWHKIKLFVFLDPDAALFIPEYKIMENLWQNLRHAQYQISSGSAILIQTRYPEHLVFKSLYRPDNFYAEQLAERRIFGYPPFKYLLKPLTSSQKSAIVERDAAETHSKLTSLTKGLLGVKILDPLQTIPYFLHGQYYQVILAKINYENYKQTTKLLSKNLPENWKTDPNPNSLLLQE